MRVLTRVKRMLVTFYFLVFFYINNERALFLVGVQKST